MILAIAETDLNDSIGAYLRNTRNPPTLEVFPQSADEDRWGSGGGAGEGGQVAAEA